MLVDLGALSMAMPVLESRMLGMACWRLNGQWNGVMFFSTNKNETASTSMVSCSAIDADVVS
eukprot:7484877-Ditylum_brightwellii.AAC.1